jgi:ABC-type transport system involved in multi-copper enzyme maturation permease subunit
MGVLGVLSVGHDYRHGLVRPVLTAVPNRSAVVLARLGVVGLVAAVVGVVGVLLNLACGLLILGGMPATPEVVRSVLGYVLLGVFWAWLGAGATWLIRNTAAVLTLLFVVPLVVEPLVVGISDLPMLHWLRPIARWRPFAAGQAMVAPGGGDGTALSALQGGLVFGAVVAVTLLAGWWQFVTRDA